MSTVFHEPHPSIRVGRFVSVKQQSRKPAASQQTEPAVPKFEEVRFLVYFGLSALTSLFGLALLGFYLLPETGSDSFAEAASPSAVNSAAPAFQSIVYLANHELTPALPEILPEPKRPAFKASPIVARLLDQREPILPNSPEKPKTGAVCEKFGTKIAFIKSPPEAFRKAQEENKQVFFVHLSGNFEDNEFT